MTNRSKQFFFLTKVTERKYAEALVKGEVYLRPIQEFWGMFNENNLMKNNYRGDDFECLSAMFKFTDNFYNTPTIPKEAKNFAMDLGLNSNNCDAIGFIDVARGSEKIYSLYSLMYDNDKNKLIMPDMQLENFGNTAVVIKDPIDFFRKIAMELFKLYGDLSKLPCDLIEMCECQPFWFQLDAVKYIIDEKQTHTALDEFCKGKSYSWQNEFRLVVDLFPDRIVHSQPVSDFALATGVPAPTKDESMFKPLVLQIGDISHICELIPTKNLLKKNELEQLGSKLGSPKEVIFPVSLYHKKTKRSAFRIVLRPKR